MHAAVVHAFDQPPRYEEFQTPSPSDEHQVLADVVAVGLHPRVRSGAGGTHYTSDGILPMIPGVDGVGRLPDGQHVFFVAPDSGLGTMADQAVIDRRRSVPLPDGLDPVIAAAAMNPAMSSWVALHRRVELTAGDRVMVLGATGNAGQMAVQIAKHLGAAAVVAVGRDRTRLDALTSIGADAVVPLDDDVAASADRVGDAACEVDVVIDYLWGPPAELSMPAILRRRADRGRRLSWIQIGAVAGREITLPSELLRSANFVVLGSGQGSVTTAGYLASFPSLLDELARGTFSVDAVPFPLADVEAVWQAPTPAGERIVLVPNAG